MDDESGEWMELMEEVPLKELGESVLGKIKTSKLVVHVATTTTPFNGLFSKLKHVDINNIPLLRPPPRSSRACETLELSSIAGWHYRHTSQRSVGLGTTAQTTSSARPIYDSRSCKNRSWGVYFLLVGLLQFAALQAAGHSTAQAAVCAECHCKTDHWHTMQWSYLASITY